jgi:hypothetical protein
MVSTMLCAMKAASEQFDSYETCCSTDSGMRFSRFSIPLR